MKNNNEKFIEKLENLAIPEIKISNHGQILKSRLLSSSHFTSSNSSIFSMLQKYFLRLKNIIDSSLMIQKRSFAFKGAVGAFALVVIIGVGTFTNGVIAHAQAQELITKSTARAVSLTPAVRAQLETLMDANMIDSLNEAKASSNVSIVTREEYMKHLSLSSKNSGAGVVLSLANKEGGTVTEPVAYLTYTNTTGHKVILGLDKDNTPVFKAMEVKEGEISGSLERIGGKAEPTRSLDGTTDVHDSVESVDARRSN